MDITRKNIDSFYAGWTKGVKIKCTENTKLPTRVGMVATVTRPGKTSIGIEDTARLGAGLISPPKRVSDVTALSEDQISYILPDGKTAVTWEVVSA